MLAFFNLLPSKSNIKIQEALASWEKNGELEIYEPCDCGSQIRHNNGGNYHQTVELIRDSGRVFVRYDDTCQLTAREPWQEVKESEVQGIIAKYADWL